MSSTHTLDKSIFAINFDQVKVSKGQDGISKRKDSKAADKRPIRQRDLT